MKKLLLSLFAAAALISQFASAETTAWCNSGSSLLRINTYTKGIYSKIDRIVIKLRPDSVDCFITDPSAFNAKLNGVDITPIAVNPDENGYAQQFIFYLSGLQNGANNFSFQRRVPYINKTDEKHETRYNTLNSNQTSNLIININPFTTIESADNLKDAVIPSHAEIIKYPFYNPPGEYEYLLGDYAIDLSSTYISFYREIDDFLRPYIVDSDGNIIQYTTNKLPRSADYKDNNVSFHVTIDKPITAPGEYWIIFPSEGNFVFKMADGKTSNSHHYSNFKIGPYIVKGKGSETSAAVKAETEWISPSEFASDHLPDSIFLRVNNAAVMSRHALAAFGTDYNSTLKFGDMSTAIINVSGTEQKNVFAFKLPTGWYNGPGEYAVTANNPAEIFEGFTADGAPLDFSSEEPLVKTFTVVDPTLPESLGLYVRSANATTYDIEENETLTLRLMHTDQALGLKIFVKWIPEAAKSKGFTTMATEDFVEHNGDVEISSPGKLEYYTQRGEIRSPIKTIEIKAADNSTSHISAAVMDSLSTEPGYYDLRGIPVKNPTIPGVYINRQADGSVRKIILR